MVLRASPECSIILSYPWCHQFSLSHLFLRLKWHPTPSYYPLRVQLLARDIFISLFLPPSNIHSSLVACSNSSVHNTLHQSSFVYFLCFANFRYFTLIFSFSNDVFAVTVFCQKVLLLPVSNTQFLKTLLHHYPLWCRSRQASLAWSFFGP